MCQRVRTPCNAARARRKWSYGFGSPARRNHGPLADDLILAPLSIPEQRLAEMCSASLDISMRQPLEGGFSAVQPQAQSGNGTRKIPTASGKEEQLKTLHEGRQEACEEGPMQAMHKGNHDKTPVCLTIMLSPSNIAIC